MKSNEEKFESMSFKNFVIFSQTIYQVVPYAQDFLRIKFFLMLLRTPLLLATSKCILNRYNDAHD